MDKLEQNLRDYKDSEGLLTSIKALCNDFFKDVTDKDEKALPDLLKQKMNELYDKMDKENLINAKNLKSAMEGINQALVSGEEKGLYELFDKRDEINRAIEAKREEIKNRLKSLFFKPYSLLSNCIIFKKIILINRKNKFYHICSF